MVRVLIVGAGVTGALCAHMLRRHLPTQLQCQIVVWEKSRGCGGRMATSRHQQCMAELGAQYITQNAAYAKDHKVFYDELLKHNILKPMEGKVEGFRGEKVPCFVSTGGLAKIAKYFFSKSMAEMCFNQRLESLRLTSEETSSDWSVWEAVTEKNNHSHFDAVIVTAPVPQIMDIGGIMDHLTVSQAEDLRSVKYSSRFATGLFYEPGTFDLELPHIANYVKDNEVIRFYSLDHEKRGASGKASIVAHTSVSYGAEHVEEDKDVVGPKILDELKKVIPNLPEPDHVKYHKWRYSQVTNATKEHSGCMALADKPLLLLAGDAFTHSNFDGCLASALAADREFVRWAGSL